MIPKNTFRRFLILSIGKVKSMIGKAFHSLHILTKWKLRYLLVDEILCISLTPQDLVPLEENETK